MKLKKLSPSLVVSIVALIVAMGGTTWAAVSLPRNSVGAPQLKDDAVTKQKIRPNAVNAGALGDGAVGPAELKDAAVSEPKLDPALLSAIESPSVRFVGTEHWETALTQQGSCGGSVGPVPFPAATFDRLVFVSFEAVRTAASGTTTYTVHRPGGNISFQLTGPDTKTGEGFYAVPAGSTPLARGVAIDADDCAGSGGTLTADYRVIELEQPPSEPCPLREDVSERRGGC